MIPRCSFLVTAIFAAGTVIAEAQVGPVRIRVEQFGQVDTTGYKSVQSRHLSVHIVNTTMEPLDAKVRFAIFGRNLKDREVVTVEEGGLLVPIGPVETRVIQTPTARAAGEEARMGSKGKTDAKGCKIVGHGVQLWQGETLLAEAYEPPGMKEFFGKAPPAEKITKRRKKKE